MKSKTTASAFITILFVLIMTLFNLTVKAQIGFSQIGMNNASAYSASTGGVAVIIMQNENVIFENYHNGADSSTATHIHSATKFFWASIAALALQNGLITSYDELVSNTITEWQDTTLHPGKRYIKIRHLLSLSSGLSQDVAQIQGTTPLAPDIYQYCVDSLNLIAPPGTFFQYGPSHYYVFAVLLQRKLHHANILINPLQYLENEILNQIGLTYQTWEYDSVGNPHIPNGCYLTPRNWIKFGQFMLQKGRWGTIQIIDSNRVENMFIGDGPNPGHGKFCWINGVNGYGYSTQQAAPPGSPGGFIYYDGYNEIIGAMGAGKNRMYLIPSLNAVILRQTLAENDAFNDDTFLSYLLDNLTSVGENNKSQQDMLIYPNPTAETVHLQTNSEKIKSIEIYNLQGQFIREYFTNDFSVSNLPEGIYFIRVETDKSIYTNKLLKQP